MAWSSPPAVRLSKRQRRELTKLAARTSAPHALVQRARMVLRLASGQWPATGADLLVERGKPICSIAYGEVVAARIGVGTGEHPWGDTGFVLLRHPLEGNKSIFSPLRAPAARAAPSRP